jgi:nucleoside-diphosphate-sugar epimerase
LNGGDPGFKPKYDLKTGLKETIEWYRENGYISC